MTLDYLWSALVNAVKLIITLDEEVINIVGTSLKLSTTSTILAALAGVPLGILISRIDFKGRFLVNTILNTLLSLPTVVVGLFVYTLLSSRGPLGEQELLFTFKGIIIGQFILILPIVVVLVRNAIFDLDERIYMTARSLGATGSQGLRLLISEARYGILGAIVTAYGRVIAEVGISMMIGGNIRRVTRTITTAIALETNKGQFSFGLALGIILLFIAFLINLIIHYLQTGVNR